MFVTEPVSPVVTTVPVTAGNVIVPLAVFCAKSCVCPVVAPFRLRPELTNRLEIVGVLLRITVLPEPEYELIVLF